MLTHSTHLVAAVAHLEEGPGHRLQPDQLPPQVVLGHREVESRLAAPVPHVVDVADVLLLGHGGGHPVREVEVGHPRDALPHGQTEQQVAGRVVAVVEGHGAEVAQQLAGGGVVVGLQKRKEI